MLVLGGHPSAVSDTWAYALIARDWPLYLYIKCIYGVFVPPIIKKQRIAIDTALPYNTSMEFIEATTFTKYVYSYLTDDETMGLQGFLLEYPETGKVVPGTGGVRKLQGNKKCLSAILVKKF